MTCCRDVPRPKPWAAGVDDTADPYMVARMENIASRLSAETPLAEFIKLLRVGVQIDGRTMLGYHLQACLMHNAADRLDILANDVNPRIWESWRDRVRQAWLVLCGRAAIVVLK